MIKSRIPNINTREHKMLPGMKKCRKCVFCPYVLEGNKVQTRTMSCNMLKQFNCNTQNVIYMIECEKNICRNNENYIYIGETGNPIKERIAQHIGYIKNKVVNKSTGHHFNTPGHSVSDLDFRVLEQARIWDPVYRKEREKYHIRIFNSYYSGLNRAPE